MDYLDNSTEGPRPAAGGSKRSTAKTRRYLVAAALLGGGVTLGAIFSPIGLAGAQSADTADATVSDSADTDADSDTDGGDAVDEGDGDEYGERGHHGRRGRGLRLTAASEIIGLDEAELREALTDGQTLAQIAEGQGVATDDLVAGLLAAAEAHLDEAVSEGRIDADEAEERLAEAPERIEALVNREISGEGFGPRARHARAHVVWGADLPEVLGLSAEDIGAGFEDGKTLVEIAAEQGVSEQELVDALVASANERIETALADGKIDADRAEELQEGVGERIAELVNRAPGDRPHAGEWGANHRRAHRHHNLHERLGGGGDDVDGETSESVLST